MKIEHPHYHWALVALVLVAALATLKEAHGQASASMQFEGRPALAGAQAGLGAQAGVAQGGIGVQGSDLASRSVRPARNPAPLDELRQVHRDGGDMVAAADKDLSLRKEAIPPKDKGIAKEQRSASRKAAKAAKRTWRQARHGVSTIDSKTAQAKVE